MRSKLHLKYSLLKKKYNVHCIIDDIGNFPVIIVFRKGFPRRVTFNKMLKLISEEGFSSKWHIYIIETKSSLGETSVTDFESFSIRLKHLLSLCKTFMFKWRCGKNIDITELPISHDSHTFSRN